MKVNSIKFNDIEVCVGDMLSLTLRAYDGGYGEVGDRVKVISISQDASKTSRSILFLRRDTYHPNWSDANGKTKAGFGMAFEMCDFDAYFDKLNMPMIICGTLVHKKRNLKGMECTVLARLTDEMVAVQFNEDIMGCSADGLGKRGHCLLVNKIMIKEKPKTDRKSLLFKQFS